MPAARLNFTLEQGATWAHHLQLQAAGVDMDLTGYSARMQLRESAASPDVLLELSTDNGRISLPDPTTGRITLALTDEETAGITWERAVYDLLIESPTGTVTRLVGGSVTVSPGVTR